MITAAEAKQKTEEYKTSVETLLNILDKRIAAAAGVGKSHLDIFLEEEVSVTGLRDALHGLGFGTEVRPRSPSMTEGGTPLKVTW